MGRKIADPEVAAESPASPDSPQGVAFVKNQLNEVIKFEDGTTFKFTAPRMVINDPELAEKLRAVKDRYNIIEPE